MRKVVFEAIVTLSAGLALAGCGGDGGSATSADGPPAAVTPVPSGTPVPSPDDGIHATPTAVITATATATPSGGAGTGGAEAGDDDGGGAGGGDEGGIRVPVAVTVSPGRIRASEDRVAAFLPVRFTLRSRLDREVQVVVRSGEGGGAAGRATLPAGGTATIDVDGLPPGSLEVLSPDIDPDMTAIVTVARGG